MSIEGFHTSQQLSVVPTADQDLLKGLVRYCESVYAHQSPGAVLRTWELVLTLFVKTCKGPFWNSSSSFFSSSSTLGLVAIAQSQEPSLSSGDCAQRSPGLVHAQLSVCADTRAAAAVSVFTTLPRVLSCTQEDARAIPVFARATAIAQQPCTKQAAACTKAQKKPLSAKKADEFRANPIRNATSACHAHSISLQQCR